VQFEDHPQFVVTRGKPVVLTAAEELKSFWYKVRCKLYRDLFQLCPPKKNLRSNLDVSLQGLKYCKILENAAGGGKSTAIALSTEHRGRPIASSKILILFFVNQSFFADWRAF
jgi:hypothetical protein